MRIEANEEVAGVKVSELTRGRRLVRQRRLAADPGGPDRHADPAHAGKPTGPACAALPSSRDRRDCRGTRCGARPRHQ
ncbi:hypothetical protein ACU4GD_19385 [Cupriavidus basilensis]